MGTITLCLLVIIESLHVIVYCILHIHIYIYRYGELNIASCLIEECMADIGVL